MQSFISQNIITTIVKVKRRGSQFFNSASWFRFKKYKPSLFNLFCSKMSSDSKEKRICLIGCGPSGMSFLHHIGKLPDGVRPEVVCYEKQSTWGGMWNVTWRTGIMLLYTLHAYFYLVYFAMLQ